MYAICYLSKTICVIFQANNYDCQKESPFCLLIHFDVVLLHARNGMAPEDMYLLSLQPGEIREKIVDVVPFLERTPTTEQLDNILSKPGSRILRTHLPSKYFTLDLNNIHKDIKVLVGKRNPQNALVSYYHFYHNNPIFGPFRGDWNDFFQFKEKRLVHGDYFDFYESWGNEAAKSRPNGKILFVNYENLKEDLLGSVQTVSSFLGKEHYEERLQFVASNCQFEVMKSNPMASPSRSVTSKFYFRKGIVGDWKNTFTQEESEYVDLLDQRLSRKLQQLQLFR